MDSGLDAVTGETVSLVDYNILPLLPRGVPNHFLERKAVIVCTRHGAVYILIQNHETVVFGELLADGELTLDGLLCLTFGRVSRVNDRFFHRNPPFEVFVTSLIFCSFLKLHRVALKLQPSCK